MLNSQAQVFVEPEVPLVAPLSSSQTLVVGGSGVPLVVHLSSSQAQVFGEPGAPLVAHLSSFFRVGARPLGGSGGTPAPPIFVWEAPRIDALSTALGPLLALDTPGVGRGALDRLWSYWQRGLEVPPKMVLMMDLGWKLRSGGVHEMTTEEEEDGEDGKTTGIQCGSKFVGSKTQG